MSVTIHEHGYWNGPIDDDEHKYDPQLSQAIVDFFKSVRAESVLDLGCGKADYVKHLRSSDIQADGVDGNPNTPQLSGGVASVQDLAVPCDLGARDWVLTLEIAEHIPKQFEEVFIQNIHRHNKRGVVLSWAVPGQGGTGHFNEQSNDYVIQRMSALGYRYDAGESQKLRQSATLWWFRNTAMVFLRMQ